MVREIFYGLMKSGRYNKALMNWIPEGREHNWVENHGSFSSLGQAPSLDTGEPAIRQTHFSRQAKISLIVDNSVG